MFDLSGIKDTFKQFWGLENDIALVTIKAYKNKKGFCEYVESKQKDKRYRTKFHLNADPMVHIQNQVDSFQYMHYTGVTAPILNTDICPCTSAAILGSTLNFKDDAATVWLDHTLDKWDNFPINFDERNIWWILHKSMVEFASKAARETGCFMGIPIDLFGGVETLMMLRGSENLCLDFMLEPDLVKDKCKEIMGYWKRWVEELFLMTDANKQGNCTPWLKYWGPGKTYCLQSDFMTMISPAMYEEFLLPDIVEMCKYLDHSMFHFDGPDEVVRHLPFLLDIKELGGIQWNPAQNCVNVRHIPTLKKIQAAGKCLVLNTTVDELEPLLEELSPRGLLLNVNPFSPHFDTPEQADEIMRRVEQFSKKKKYF